MPSAGSYLRELRERRGVSLEEIARSTRVARHYLDALEADDLKSLPAPVFTRGFIRAYCQLLGEPPDEALARFDRPEGVLADDGQGQARAARPVRTVSAAAGDRRARGAVLVSLVLLIVLGVALFVVTLALQPGRDDAAGRRAAVGPARPSAGVGSDAAPPTTDVAARAPEPAGGEASAAGAPLAIGPVSAPYRLVARATEAVWVRVRMEDGRSTEETLHAGEVREWVSNRPFVVTLGNAGGISLELNGRPLPRIGARGAVIPRLVLPPDGS